ncbi:Armadillo type fold, partial [Fasciola gigantica]
QSGEAVDLLPTLDLLCAPKKLDREKGEERLRDASLTPRDLSFLCQWISDKLEGLSNWEETYGGLIAANIILQSISAEQLMELNLIPNLEAHVLECHDNYEFRVRIAAGQLMGTMCRREGLSMFRKFLPNVIHGVIENLERAPDAPATETDSALRELIVAKDRDFNMSRSSLSIFHDTAGWKHLETWMKCLQQMVINLTPEDFIQIERSDILDLIFKAVQHVNRFVRETGYDVLATMIQGHGCYNDPNTCNSRYVDVARQLATGLSDNWSQVRFAASRAVRTFFEVNPPPGHQVDEVLPILLPPMCLNRYYVAEGVRIYSQDTWCRVTKGEGRKLISSYLESALEYYIQQSDADNHAVREAACASIAESVAKLDSALLLPHIGKLLNALFICFDDESWPVRDAACTALGTLISVLPEATRESGYPDLMAERFLRNLSDSIPSVRDGAAYSIARILNATGDPQLVEMYTNYIREKLAGVIDQPAESHGSESTRVHSKGPGVSHVITRSGADAHDQRHTDQVMYSCGSLAPKLQKGRKAGGCHDGLHQRESEPWERADGAIRLVGHLAECAVKYFVDSMIDQIMDAVSRTHYTHYPYLLETACQIVPQLLKGLEKARFKRHLDNLLIVMTAAVECQLPLAVVAAEESLSLLMSHIGPNVIRGRVENHMDPRVSRTLVRFLPPPN